MTTRKAIALASMVLALAVLSPASALAKAGGSQRPTKGTNSATISLDLSTLTFTANGTVVMSHLGRVTGDLTGKVRPVVLPSGLPAFVGDGSMKLVAANGDELTGTFRLETTALLPEGHTTTNYIDVGGGTGRFADADGELTMICQVGPGDRVTVPGKMISNAKCATTGTISY